MIKTKVVNELIKSKKLKPYYIINHSYTDNGGRDLDRLIVSKDTNIFPCLTTRPDTLGITVMTTKIDKNKRFQVVDYHYDEGIRGRVDYNISPTLVTKDTTHSLSGNPMVLEIEREREELQMQIRKLVPLECMRLMGFERKDYEAMRQIGMSDSAIYHCAGDSIVVPCLIALFSEFFNEQDKHIEIIENYVERVKQ